ncbi:MAG: epoxyqueuosine reductase [Nitrospiraceae bacterium]|nr:MAG: epoxyqueuosine reductase [Nitrospiraceae bacterium]
MNDELEKALLEAGADIVGFADVTGILKPEIAHLKRAISIGVCRNLNENTLRILSGLRKRAVTILKKKGFRYLSIPADSDRIKDTFIAKLYPLFPHKIAATSAGLGWIGRNGLLINPKFGPRLSLTTVLTDAPLITSKPVETSQCGECSLCVEFCPSVAITGNEWSRNKPYIELVRLNNCRGHKGEIKEVSGKPNCGLCITICPYGRKIHKKEEHKAEACY